jgi:hypothetical protein
VRVRPATLALPVLGVLLLRGWITPSPRPVFGGAAWPSLSHPLGIDGMGRDFLAVLSAGVVDFARPGLIMVALLIGVLAARSWWFLRQPVLPERGEGQEAAGLAAASPPRLLLVMVGMLLLEEPSPLFAAGIVAGLYAPVALVEVTSRLRDLREQEVLAGVVAHGLPARRILSRHLLRGWLRESVARHSAALFTQVAFTQIALAYIFGTSSVTAGMGVSWGMEFRKLSQALPGRTGFHCVPGQVCEQAISAFQGGLMLLASLALLGGVLRLARPQETAA